MYKKYSKMINYKSKVNTSFSVIFETIVINNNNC